MMAANFGQKIVISMSSSSSELYFQQNEQEQTLQ